MKRPTNLLNSICYAAALLALIETSSSSLRAQSTFTNTAGGDWNTAANWNPNGVPAEGTNAVIASAVTVSYSAPMAASSVGTVVARAAGVLNIAASGFNVDTNGLAVLSNPAIMVSGAGSTGFLNVNSGGRVLVSNTVASSLPANWGAVSISTNGVLTVNSGGSLNISNTSGSLSLAVGFQGPSGSGNSGRHPGGTMVINGGTVNVDQNLIVACGNSSGSTASSLTVTNGASLNVSGTTRLFNPTDDSSTRIILDGATANLGNVSITRCGTTGGLSISNGVVNMTSMDFFNGISRAFAYIMGGNVTNTGAFYVGNRTNAATSGTRTGSFIQRGGTIYSSGSGGIVICNQGNTNAPGSLANILSTLEITGGTLWAEQITLNNPTITANAASQLILGGTGTIYLGAGGLVANLPANSVYTVSLTGGTLAPKSTSFGIGADLTFSSGTATIQCADASSTPYDIWMTNVIAGSGTFAKTGGGKFTVLGVATHTGTISINAGTLALDGSGSLPSSAIIAVGTGATFDTGPGFTLNSAKILRGTGTVTNNFTAASGSFIKPADDGVIGTLTFTNNLTESGGAKNNFDITSPAVADQIVVGGTLDISAGVDPVNVSFVGSPTVGTYQLFKYGTLVGDTNNLSYSGLGYLTNNTATKTIDLVLTVERSPTNLVWLGDSVLNNWDFNSSFNWTNNGSGATFKFLTGDSVTFNNQGSVSPAVNLVGDLQPNGITVNASVDYTFGGDARIMGTTGLTKTNSGRLTILIETNEYTGVTTLAGGTLSVSNLANIASASPIGAPQAGNASIVFNGGTLEYLGANNKNINRGATLQSGGGTVSVFDPAVALTFSGLVTGSGVLTKTGNGQLNLNVPNDYSGGTVVTAGSVRAGQPSSINLSALGTNTLTLNGGVSPAAFVFGADAQVLTNTLSIVGNNNYITNGGNDTVDKITGSGTVYLEGVSGNTFTMEADVSGFSGTMVADTIGFMRFHPSTGSSNAIFDLGNNSAVMNNRNGNQTINVGALKGGASTQVRGASSADNPTTYLIGGKNLDTTFDGTITEVSTPRRAHIVKVGTATLTLTGTSTYGGSTTVSNGVLALSGTGSFDNSTNISIVSPGKLDVSARGDTTLNLGAGSAPQILRGNGTLLGSLNVGANGTVAPGFSIGTLTATNAVTLGGNSVMEINRSGFVADKLVATNIAFGGTLTIKNIGATLQVGDTFDLFDGSLGGTFATVNGGYFTWNTNNLAVDGTVSVSGILPPPTLSVTATPTDITLTSTGGLPGGALSIVTSTDVTLSLDAWTVVLNDVFDGSGNYTSAPIAIDPNTPRRFYAIRAF